MGRKNRTKQGVNGVATQVALTVPLARQQPLIQPQTVSVPIADPAVVVEREEFLRRDAEFGAYRAGLVAAESDTAKEYDKWILTLAGGALGFSLTLLRDFIGTGKQAILVELLHAAWMFFGLAILLILINLHLSFTAFGKCKNIADDEYREDCGADVFQRITARHGKIRRLKAIKWLNVISLISFALGVIAMAIFINLNSR